MDYFYLCIGIIVLIIGGNLLVKGSVSLALHLKISTLFVGLVIVSFATSFPELVVSINAALNGHQDIALGNVIGSNIANIGLVLGLTACVLPIRIVWKSYKKNYLMLLISSIIFSILIFYFHAIKFWMGIIFLFSLFLFIYYLLKKNQQSNNFEINLEEGNTKKSLLNFFKSIVYLLVGMIGLYYGSEILIESAVLIAHELGVTERVIAVSVVAIGTSIPELATSLIAAFKNEKTLAIGNIIGSNIFNILAVLGITSFFTEIQALDSKIYNQDIWIMVFFVVVLYVLIRFLNKNFLNKVEGIILLTLYVSYVYLMFVL